MLFMHTCLGVYIGKALAHGIDYRAKLGMHVA
jgi:hypothetical protein